MTRLLVCAPLRLERAAISRRLPAATVLRTGMGPRRSRRVAEEVARHQPDALAVAGLGGALTDELAPGDVVVATEVRGPDGVRRCPSYGPLVGALRGLGVRAHAGPVVSSPRVVDGAERVRLGGTGALAVDMESAQLLAAAGDRPVAVVRVVVDTPSRPLARPGTVRTGTQALRTLRRVAPALHQWAQAVGSREVVLAHPRSFCAGVERAIEIVERALERHGPPVFVRKQIVHNAHVVADLERRGAVFVDELDAVPDGATVVFSAHGVAPAVRAEAADRGLAVVDASCPLVTKVHAEARRFVRRGDTVVLVGHAGHEEVEGTLGEAPGTIRLVEDAEQARALDVPEQTKVSYLMQTTLAVDEARDVVDALRERFPDLDGPGADDICYATTNRQDAVRAVAADADLVLVVGSANSSNSQRLVEVARRSGSAAHLVDDPCGIDPSWLVGARTVGLTAGASAPPHLVDEVVDALGGFGPVTISQRSVANETLRFTLPKEVS